jgi:hypothetical protein
VKSNREYVGEVAVTHREVGIAGTAMNATPSGQGLVSSATGARSDRNEVLPIRIAGNATTITTGCYHVTISLAPARCDVVEGYHE